MTNSFKRPKLNIPKTKSEWIFDCIGLLFFIGSIILLIVVWGSLPEKVPAHYTLGEVNRWGIKLELIILPIVSGFLLLMMSAFEKHPEIHNYPKRLNEENVEQFYLTSRKGLNQIKNVSLILLSLIVSESVSIAMNWSNGFGIWFFVLLLLGTGIPIVLLILKMRKIK